VWTFPASVARGRRRRTWWWGRRSFKTGSKSGVSVDRWNWKAGNAEMCFVGAGPPGALSPETNIHSIASGCAHTSKKYTGPGDLRHKQHQRL
jgi:hypothetical protein